MQLTDPQIKIILDGCRVNKRQAQKELYLNYYDHAMSIVVLYPFDDNSTVEIINEAFLETYIHLRNNTVQFENTVDSFKEILKKAVLQACTIHRKKFSKEQIMTWADPGGSPLSIEYRGA